MPYKPKSFRDPDARLYEAGDHMIRAVDAGFGEFLTELMGRHAYKSVAGKVIATEQLVSAGQPIEDLPEPSTDKVFLKHRKIPFANYPCEWPADMLHAAGALTVDLAASVLGEGAGLKDATPHNVMFEGANPIFLDVASFEQRDPGDPYWLPEGQFLRNFIYPLIVATQFRMPVKDILGHHRDGISADDVYRMLSTFRKIDPTIFRLITLPVVADRFARNQTNLHGPKLAKDPAMATFILERLFKRLQNHLARLDPSRRKGSFWSGYMADHLSYDDGDFATKERIVESVIDDLRPGDVLDIGCNTGNFSKISARSGASVVAIDGDEFSVGSLWREAHRDQLDILPLVVDVVNPTPAMGWNNLENDSFLARAEQKFDLTLMLAVIHHMMIDGGIGIGEILKAVRQMTRQALLIEYVDPADEMFQKLLKGRQHLYAGFNRDGFVSELNRVFSDVREVASLKDGHRVLYLASV